MSYSFSVKADTKHEAGKKVEEQLALVVHSQPAHATDRQAAQDAAEAFIDMLGAPNEDQCISVVVYGSLGWRGENDFTSANVSVTASLISKE